jgi:hypothetical protein
MRRAAEAAPGVNGCADKTTIFASTRRRKQDAGMPSAREMSTYSVYMLYIRIAAWRMMIKGTDCTRLPSMLLYYACLHLQSTTYI